jgi:hypothetical protein
MACGATEECIVERSGQVGGGMWWEVLEGTGEPVPADDPVDDAEPPIAVPRNEKRVLPDWIVDNHGDAEASKRARE